MKRIIEELGGMGWTVVILLILAFGFLVVLSDHQAWEIKRLRAQLAHYREVTHTTPPLCVEAEVAP
jgi:hypothetical protein